jgi:hypothetical protein
MKTSVSINHHEIAQLAYLNWQKAGCPSGRDQEHWLEAEQQLKATKHLLVAEVKPSMNDKAAASKSKNKGA